MAFEKEKTMRAAEKYLSQGKIPAAIKEYRQIVENEPNDFTVLNLLGDLYVRQDSQEDAIDCFMRVAEHYRAEGFALKAIAMYKKIDRLNPGTLEIAAKLAPLYQMQGLMVDARANYLVVADAYQRAGQTQKALDVLRKIADLDPQNTEIRIKLAEGYQRENCLPEAVEAYVEAGSRLLDKNHFDRSIEAFSAALKLRPYDCAALSGMASTYIAMGVPDDAAELLERAVADQPDDPELLSMLTHAYIEMENAQAAERATTDLIAIEPSSYNRLVDVARLYLKQADLDSAVRVVKNASDELFTNNEDEELSKILHDVLSRNPEHIEALKLLARVYTWQRDNDKLRATLERLVDSAQLAGLVDEERNALSQLARLSPHERRFTERLQELGGTIEDLPSLTPSPSFSFADEPVPSFDGFSSFDKVAQQEETVQFEFFSNEPALFQPTADPSSSFADLNDSWFQSEEKASKPPTSPESSAGFHELEFDFSGQIGQERKPTPAESNLTDAKAAHLKQELESVDFYISQGYMDVARSTLDLLEQQNGSHPEITARRRQIVISDSAQTTTSSKFEFQRENELLQTPSPLNQQQPIQPQQPTNIQMLDPGLAEIFDEFREAFEEEETELSSGDFETHFNMGLAYKDMDLLDEAIEEFQQAIALCAPKDGTARYLQCCNLLAHCFSQKGMPKLSVMWYKRGLDAPGHSEDEYQALRFDMGLAFEQMGDIDQAIDTFTEVYGVNVSYRNVGDKLRELQELK